MNSVRLEDNTISSTINKIFGYVKESMKNGKNIDRQLHELSKKFPKDLKPDFGVEECIKNNWSWIPKPTFKCHETISCISQSI